MGMNSGPIYDLGNSVNEMDWNMPKSGGSLLDYLYTSLEKRGGQVTQVIFKS